MKTSFTLYTEEAHQGISSEAWYCCGCGSRKNLYINKETRLPRCDYCGPDCADNRKFEKSGVVVTLSPCKSRIASIAVEDVYDFADEVMRDSGVEAFIKHYLALSGRMIVEIPNSNR